MARGLAAILGPDQLTVIVNVGDDERIYGAHVSADLDTVTYTLAGIAGPQGWGLADDTFTVMDALDALGEDTSFRLGDRDLATCLMRSAALDAGEPLSSITRRIRTTLGIAHRILPATDDWLRTKLRTSEGEWLDFQDYFVIRHHRDEITRVRYEGEDEAMPAPGVLEAIEAADAVIIAPSNPPLSIHPILTIPGVVDAVRSSDRVIAISPLFAGKALKGPADRIMASLGMPPGTAGVLAAYEGLLTDLVIDIGDSNDSATVQSPVTIHATDTHIIEPAAATRFARWTLELL
jgi:LPPG:FO 2-phospho-L-lactate transferase